MGIFNLFKTGKTLVGGKADQAAQAIEDADPILFAEQDIKKMSDELKVAQSNVAKMKASKMQIERDMKELQDELKTRKEQGSQLKQAGKTAPLTKVVERIGLLMDELAPLESSLKTTKGYLKQHEDNTIKLKSAVDEATRDLRSLKAMAQVTKSTEALAEVSTAGADSALAKFKERKRKQQNRLDEATALMETQNAGDDLDEDIDKALGNSKQKDILDSL